jgi:hypothetical protein
VTVVHGFWLQHGSQGADQLVSLADDLEQVGARPGVIFAPVGTPAKLKQLYQRVRERGEAFLDPSGYLLDRGPSPQRRGYFPWLEQKYKRPTDVAKWTDWMKFSLEHQLSERLRGEGSGPSIVVTPSPQLTAAAGTDELYAIVDAANVVRGLMAEECWLGVVVDRDYLRQETRLTELANTLVTAGFQGIVFRCFHSELAPVTDRRVLEGVRELVEGCAAAGIGILLPNSGWLGWLAMAWGATGFSGGLAKSSWYDRMPGAMANVQRKETFFEPQLIRHVSWTVHSSLAQVAKYIACACTSCSVMGDAYEPDLAKVHQIRIAHGWNESLRSENVVARRRKIRARLDAAIDFRDDLPVRLRERTEASFLDTWRALV